MRPAETANGCPVVRQPLDREFLSVALDEDWRSRRRVGDNASDTVSRRNHRWGYRLIVIGDDCSCYTRAAVEEPTEVVITGKNVYGKVVYCLTADYRKTIDAPHLRRAVFPVISEYVSPER
jgi:hypothetical protein